MKDFKVIGAGQLIYDHIFTEEKGKLIYQYSRGGGTIGNVLANLSQYNIPNLFLGPVGTRNIFGLHALEELSLLGTDISLAQRVHDRNTLIIFQRSFIKPEKAYYKHEFSTRCFICEGVFDWRSTPNEEKYFSQVQRKVHWEQVYLLFTDKVTKARDELLHTAKQNKPNLLTLLDLGHIGHMRFWSMDVIVQRLRYVDILFASHEVANFLQKRLRCKDDIKKFAHKFMRINPELKVFVLTQGEKGVQVFFSTRDSNSIGHEFLPAPQIEKPIYPEGSGDALIAAFIKQLYEKRITPRNKTDWPRITQTSLETFTQVLSHLGARGHITRPLLNNDLLSRYSGKTVREIRSLTKQRVRCPFCGQTNLERISTDEIFRRVRGIKSSPNFQKSILLCQHIFSLGQSFTVVGTGGSYSPAAFIHQLFLKKGRFSSLYFPYQYLEFGIPADWLIILSYSGKTRDYYSVIEHAYELEVKHIALITGNPNAPLAKLLRKQDILVNYETLPVLEKGFLSFAGVLLPSMLCAIALYPDEIGHNYIEYLLSTPQEYTKQQVYKLIEGMKKSGILEVFWDVGGWAAFLDIETKMIESGLSAVIGHEFKNFSHGRFMYTMGKKEARFVPKLFLQTTHTKYSEFLYQQIQKGVSDTHLMLMRSKESGIKGMIEMLYKVNRLFFAIAQNYFTSRVDVTKPKNIPKEGLLLYRFLSKEKS